MDEVAVMLMVYVCVWYGIIIERGWGMVGVGQQVLGAQKNAHTVSNTCEKIEKNTYRLAESVEVSIVKLNFDYRELAII